MADSAECPAVLMPLITALQAASLPVSRIVYAGTVPVAESVVWQSLSGAGELIFVMESAQCLPLKGCTEWTFRLLYRAPRVSELSEGGAAARCAAQIDAVLESAARRAENAVWRRFAGGASGEYAAFEMTWQWRVFTFSVA